MKRLTVNSDLLIFNYERLKRGEPCPEGVPEDQKKRWLEAGSLVEEEPDTKALLAQAPLEDLRALPDLERRLKGVLKKDLVKLADRVGLSAEGTKEDIVSRITGGGDQP